MMCFASIMLNQEIVTQALKSVKYPGYSRDIVSFGIVKSIAVNAGAVSVSLQLTGGNPAVAEQIKAGVEKALRALPELEQLHVEIASAPAAGGGDSVVAAKQDAGDPSRGGGGQRQGRRGQVHRLGQPGLRFAPPGRAGRIARLRYLRAEHPPDDGRPGKTDGQQRRETGSAGRGTASS